MQVEKMHNVDAAIHCVLYDGPKTPKEIRRLIPYHKDYIRERLYRMVREGAAVRFDAPFGRGVMYASKLARK